MIKPLFNPQDLTWIDKLAENDFVLLDDFISEKELTIATNYFQFIIKKNNLEKAGIGSQNYKINTAIRGDFIYWLEQQKDAALQFYFHKITELIKLLNRHCFLSISGSEFHLAYYPPNSFYKKHIDQFKERNNRLISVVLYLNKNWKKGDGGELKIYKHDKEIIINPIAGRLLLFKSELIEHEVLITKTGRKSITGWLLHHPSGLGYLY